MTLTLPDTDNTGGCVLCTLDIVDPTNNCVKGKPLGSKSFCFIILVTRNPSERANRVL